MRRYPEAAWERAMKVQEVILRAMAKSITWWQAAEIIGISDRSMRRWKKRYEDYGYDGLFDRRQGKPSPRRVSVARVEEVLRLYQERYFDLNVRHFHEKLREEHGIKLSYTWVKRALQGAGLVKRGRKRGAHRKRRPRRPMPGMLLHLDGSRHAWFQDDRWYDLLEVLDDASSQTYYARLVEEESTRTQTGHAFVPVGNQDLDRIFTVQTERVVAQDNTVRVANRVWQIEKTPWRGTLAGCRVTVCEHLDGRVSIVYGPHTVGEYTAGGERVLPKVRRRARVGAAAFRGANLSRPTGSFGQRPTEASLGG
jgi:transposase